MSVVKRAFSREFKLQLCEQIRLGQTTRSKACREHSLSNGLMDRWIDQYEQKGMSAFQSQDAPPDLERRVKELEASLGRAHLENEFLREAMGKLGVPVKRQQ
jgi:transposase-like protein